MPDVYRVLGRCHLLWLGVETLFYAVVKAYVVPRMNKIEPPAEVRDRPPA